MTKPTGRNARAPLRLRRARDAARSLLLASLMQRADARSDFASHPFQPRIVGGMQLLVCRPERIAVDGVRVSGQFENEQIVGSLPVRIRKATSRSAAARYELVGHGKFVEIVRPADAAREIQFGPWVPPLSDIVDSKENN